MSVQAERRLEMLGEFAELLLVTARDLHQRGLEAEDNAEAARLADSLHRTGRGLRQTLALHAKLERDDKRGVVEDAREVRAETQRAVSRHRDRVAAGVDSVIWREREDREAEVLVDLLGFLLDAEELEDGFTDQPVEQLIARMCEELHLPSLLAGEGVVRSATDEGSHCDPNHPRADSPAQPLIRPDGHLLPQGEKDDTG